MQIKLNRGWSCFAVGLTVLLFGASMASAQLLNPGFESPNASGGDVYGSANWNVFNQAFTTAAFAHSGSQCLKTYGPFSQFGGTGAVQALAALPGQTWVAEVWVLNSAADPIDNVDFGVLKIEFLNASFGLVAGGVAGVDVFESAPVNASTPQDVWTKLGVGSAPAPAGTAYANIVLVKVDMDGAQGGSIFWDDATLFTQTVAVQGTTFGVIKQLYR